MSLGFDLRRALRRNSHSIAFDIQVTGPKDCENSKARHILGLDETSETVRSNSVSSTSTRKLQSVGFSDATTAAGSAYSTTEPKGDRHPKLGRDPAILLLHPDQLESQSNSQSLRAKKSHESLRSTYDRTKAPIQVAQQTSDSSSRDFALRRGAPSIISAKSQEMEHSRQLRFFSRTSRSKQHKKHLSPYKTALSTINSSQPSFTPSIYDTRSEAGDSVTSQSSVSRISVTRATSKPTHSVQSLKSKTSAAGLRPSSSSHQQTEDPDPARAKVNVRRPKVGAKNWFDSLESDSDEEAATEPQLKSDFEAVVVKAFEGERLNAHPLRSSPYVPSHKSIHLDQSKPQTPVLSEQHSQSTLLTNSRHKRTKKLNRLQIADLTKESVLCLTSSDDEDSMSEPLSAASYQEFARREIRDSLMNVPFDPRVEIGQALTIDPRDSENLLQVLRADKKEAPVIPRRTTSRMMTYLDDQSTETLTPNDLLRSFPHTPSEPSASARESLVSEDDSIMSTKMMTVTRQEEQLIAAMRLKKCAMKRAQAKAHRQSALQILEHDSERYSEASRSAVPLRSPSRALHAKPRFPQAQHNFRSDSVTTIQTDSLKNPSIRSSIATYLTEGSFDSHLPRSQSSRNRFRESAIYAREPQPLRDTFLSEMTVGSTDDENDSLGTPTARTSHVVVLDPLDRQMLREEIPSQLFMERPFIGWERALQAAH